MLWVKVGTHIGDHERFLAAGAEARDLYFWGLTYAGKHETDGEIPMVAVLASPWGAGGSANVKVATKLVTLGLWARTDTGFLILRWVEQGNETKASLSEKREAAKLRKARGGSQKVRANEQRTDASGSTSTSKSLSGSGSQIAPGPPEWWQATLDTIEMATGEKLAGAEVWLRYDGHRAGKGIAPSTRDAQYWLTTVVVPELRKDREETHRRNQRDGERTAAIVRERHGPEVKPLPSVAPLMRERARWEKDAASPEQSAAAAAQLQKLLGGVGR